MNNSTTDINYYLEVMKRRKFHFLIPMILTLAVALAVALMLPSVYSSQATVLIEAQNIPEEYVRTTVTGYVEERLQTLSQIVLSRQNLQDLINRFNPYPDLADKATTEELVERMRRDIKMEPIHAEVGGAGGRPSKATVAFVVSYEGTVPRVTAEIANALVSLYLEQNLRVREEKTMGAVLFFQAQQQELREQIERKEEKIARFKEANMHSLPELTQMNLQNMERIRNEITARRQDIQTLTDRKIYLQGQQATVDPFVAASRSGDRRNMTPEEELRVLRNEYLAQRAVKSERHPDVVRLSRQIQALEQEATSSDMLEEQMTALDEKKHLLASYRQSYSDSHPDVIRLTREVESLEGEVDRLRAARGSGSSGSPEMSPDNPAYINLQTQIASSRFEIESVRAKIAELEKTMAEYQRRIENAPRVEQQLSSLQRDYSSAQAGYQDTTAKLQSAREAMELEEGQMAEKLTLIEPPQVPEHPVKPNRKAIALLGFVLASGFGVGTAALAEFMDQSVRRSGALAEISKKPVLVAIPYLRTTRDRIRLWIIRAGILIGFAALIAGALYLLHNYYQPLDMIWMRILERF